jgi:PAS domain S-box-containing protein
VRPPETDEELQGFFDEAAVALCCVDPGGRIVWANQAALAMVGCSEAECVGRSLDEFLVEPPGAAEVLERCARGEKVALHATRLRTRSGSLKRVLIQGQGLFREGRLVHSRWLTVDVSALLEKEEAARHRAEETGRQKDEFLALLSHELRAPLGTVLVWLGLLRQGGFDSAEAARALGIIEGGARSLERIIEDLLHASRIAAGGLMLSPQLVDFRAVIQVAVDAAVGDAALKGVQLLWSPREMAVWLMGDPGRLQQAVSNLLSNAIKFTPLAGHVEVTLETSERRALLRVTDSGEGMSAGFLPFAFDRFRQQDSSSSRPHHGLGLGLYVVRHVVEHHGGSVSAESPGPGRGSTFTISLPLAADQELQGRSSGLADAVTTEVGLRTGLTVLVVDDEPDVLEALRLILQQNGIRVTTAASAQEALELVESMRPDALLSDIAMPGQDGLSLIRRVRLLPPGRGGLIPAAALSAYVGGEDRRKALLAGFQHHVRKPIDPAQLLAVIAALTRSRAAP